MNMLKKIRLNKKVLMLLTFSFLITNNVLAQKKKADTYKENLLAWKDRNLTWNDYQGEQEKDSFINEELFANPVVRTKKIGKVKYEYYEYETFFVKDKSWAIDSVKTAPMLKYNQTRFDLWELISRKAANEYSRTPNANMDEVFEFYKRLFNRRVDEMWKSTNHATDREKVNEYASKVEKELEENIVTPGSVPLLGLSNFGFGFAFGLGCHIPFSKFMGPMASFNIEGTLLTNRHEIGAEMDFRFGAKCKSPISEKKGTILEGDELGSYNIMLTYGYNVLSNNNISLTPYIGAGIGGLSGGEVDNQYYNPKKDENPIMCKGFSFNVGVKTDIRLKRTIHIKTQSNGYEASYSSIHLKPFFSLSHYSKSTGWVPSLNINVSFGQLYKKYNESR